MFHLSLDASIEEISNAVYKFLSSLYEDTLQYFYIRPSDQKETTLLVERRDSLRRWEAERQIILSIGQRLSYLRRYRYRVWPSIVTKPKLQCSSFK